MTDFKSLGLSEELLRVLDENGFVNPTPIQSQAIPLLLSTDRTDFIGLAQTGTGKTAAFGLPLLDKVDAHDKRIQALIMAPTRELGQQTAKELERFAAGMNSLKVVCVYGGANISTQIKALKSPPQILVATPGRLLDLLDRKALSIGSLDTVVLDEADEMLQMGFKEDIDKILDQTPEDRSIWLFSATMPKDIRRIVKKFMTDPKEVEVNAEHRTNTDITHQYVVTRTADKITALRRFLDLQPDMKGVMFCRTRRQTQQIADELMELGYNTEALHGDLSQAQRDAVMKRFKSKSMQLLIATDVAARGIDVDDLGHVIHHTLPDQLESYTHRSGRTARAGKKGTSLAFINSREGRKIKELEYKLGVEFEKVMVPSIEEVKNIRIQNWAKDFLKSETHPEAQDVLHELDSFFKGWEREDILRRLISRQLDQLNAQGHEGADLNVHSKSDMKKKSGVNRYFINIGTYDGVEVSDLTGFLSEVSQVDKKSFSDISIQKNCSFFDVDEKKDKGFAAKFEGVIIEGRKIRVNRDDEGNRPKKSRGHRYAGKGPGRGRRSIDNTRKGGNNRNKYKSKAKASGRKPKKGKRG